jgi:hypothetical protein
MSKTKEELLTELQELEQLESQVSSKKAQIDYQTQEVPFKVGEKYFIRTVTYFLTGQVKAVVGQFLVLDQGAWIADTGRFNEAINEGKLSEVEPINV